MRLRFNKDTSENVNVFLATKKRYTPRPGCSKLTTSLVNVSLKFQTLISNICQYFLLENVRSFCNAKNIGVFGYKVVIHSTS